VEHAAVGAWDRVAGTRGHERLARLWGRRGATGARSRQNRQGDRTAAGDGAKHLIERNEGIGHARRVLCDCGSACRGNGAAGVGGCIGQMGHAFETLAVVTCACGLRIRVAGRTGDGDTHHRRLLANACRGHDLFHIRGSIVAQLCGFGRRQGIEGLGAVNGSDRGR